jgi:hypothetical protein
MSFSMKDLMSDSPSSSQPSQAPPAATPNTGVQATPSSSVASGAFKMADLMGDNTSSSSGSTDKQSQGGQSETNNDGVAKHGLLHRAWDWVNQPIFDNVLPEGIKTSDVLRAAAFEKMYGEAYIPGFNDFDTKATDHFGNGKANGVDEKTANNQQKGIIRQFLDNHADTIRKYTMGLSDEAGRRQFAAGVGKDTADTVAGFTSPLSLGTLGLGSEEVQAVPAVGKLARVASPLVGTAFGLQGAGQTLHGLYKMGTEGVTPENVQETLSGAGQAALGAHADLGTASDIANAARERVRPITKTIAGQDVPVRPSGFINETLAKTVRPEVPAKAAENTAGAVQKGVGEVIKGATGSDADTSIKGEDRFGLRGHANDLIENQARPVFKALDELSDGEFSKAQKAEKTARRMGDLQKADEAAAKQDELTEQFRDELNDRGLDADEAWDNYRKGSALQKIASQFDTTTGPKDSGLGYQVNGDKLASAIDRIRRSAPEKNLFKKAGLADSHIDALAELGNTLREQQVTPEFGGLTKLAAKALTIGTFGHGITGLAEALTGESMAEKFGSKVMTNLLGNAMTSEPAARQLNDALKNGPEALSKWDTFKQTVADLWRDERGEAGLPGTVGTENPNSPASEAGNVPTFFSKAEQVANQKVSTGSGDSMLAALRNNGVKENEIQWLGLDDYLKGKPKVSKADLQQYINDHKIALNETNLGGNDWKNVRDLTVNRNKGHAENNRIWSDHLRYADGSSDLFNAMKEGQDVEPVIAKMPTEVQQPARRFVETDQQIRDLDKQIGDAEKNVKPSKYESYTLPGDKDNYTEKLLTLPSENSEVRQAYEKAENERNTYISTGSLVPGDVELRFQDAQTAMRKAANASKTFQSSHFDEPNVLAHTRFDDRTSLDGKKTLLLEELQSDWHQKGKKVGYQNPAPTKLPDGIFVVPENGKFQVVNREGNPLLSRLFGSEQDAKTAALTHYGEGAGNPGVPNAPFKSDWHELVIKRMLRHAAENGYDRLAWTTGDQQAARYDLSKHIGRVTYDPTDNTLQAFDPDGKNVLLETVEPKASAISEYIGKEPAQKLMEKVDAYKSANEGEDEPDIPELKGLDLKVGGDWAKALYDRAIPNFLNKYAKKWGAKVGETELDTAPSGSLRYEIVDPKGNVQDAFRNRAGAEDAVAGYNEAHRGVGKWTVRDNGTTEKVHSIDITPAMKKSVLHEGQPIAENGTPDWAGKILSRAA